MCEYSIIAPPFTLRFKEMSKEELVKYNAWYLAQIPRRIDILTKAVQCTSGYEDWHSDYSPKSLDKLGEWFASNVDIRERTKEEKQEIYAKAPDWFKNIEISDKDLTNKTFSLAIDIGMYLSQVFLKNISNLKWQHTVNGSKNWVDYGQPVIAGFKNVVFNPTQTMVVLAYGLVKKQSKEID
jgi:hypothetical protein